MMSKYSKFVVDTFYTFWVMGYITGFAPRKQRRSSDHNRSTDKLKIIQIFQYQHWPGLKLLILHLFCFHLIQPLTMTVLIGKHILSCSFLIPPTSNSYQIIFNEVIEKAKTYDWSSPTKTINILNNFKNLFVYYIRLDLHLTIWEISFFKKKKTNKTLHFKSFCWAPSIITVKICLNPHLPSSR